eukprot:6118548-Pleurochrysis_carterae.AAC.1
MRNDTLANKGGLAGTGVGGSTADGRALPALFILASMHLGDEWMEPAPKSDFVDPQTGIVLKA